MGFSNTRCKMCLGAGIIHDSFQPSRPCQYCKSAGVSPLGLNSNPHTQIIHFVGGIKRTISNIVAVWENECVHLMTGDGVEWVINKSNVLCAERDPKAGGQ